jgi:hypothetical protein
MPALTIPLSVISMGFFTFCSLKSSGILAIVPDPSIGIAFLQGRTLAPKLKIN